MKTEKIKSELLYHSDKIHLTSNDYLSIGSVLINLACTGRPRRGFGKGRYYRLVGDSASGKTWIALTCLAEAAKNPNFDNHRFIYDNCEDGALMDIRRFFGRKVERRLEPPRKIHGEPVYSHSIEDFYYHIDDACDRGEPFIYILDSMDSLSSTSERTKFKKLKAAARRGEEKETETKVAGSYGDGKAKVNSNSLRQLLKPLKSTGSILIVISQSHDSFDMFDPKSCAGGKALKYYACFEIWLSIAGRIKKNIRGKDRQLGIKARIKIKKNRVTGREREIVVHIYHSFGIDEIGSCIDYLLDEKVWRHKGGSIYAPEMDFKGTREQLICHIGKQDMENQLFQLVTETWNEIEEACTIRRKRRYE